MVGARGRVSPPLYRAFCEATGFGGTTAARRQGAGRRRRGGRRSVRRQYPSRPAVAVRARADDGQGPARRADQDLLPRAEPQRAGVDRAGGLQRLARPGRQIFQEDPVLLLHRADAEGRARRSTCRWCFSSIRKIKQDPDTKDIDEITLELYILPGGNRHRGPLEPLTRQTREASRHGRYEEPRLPSGRARSLAADRRASRRHACSAALVMWFHENRYGTFVMRARPRRRARHHVQLVGATRSTKRTPAITRRSSSFTCATG